MKANEMKTTTHTPGPWRVLADPEHAGKHPLHDSRFIVTANASFEETLDPAEWTLEYGSLICSTRDTVCQAGDARLIAAAPDLLAFVRMMAGCVKWSESEHGALNPMEHAVDAWIQKAREMTRDLPIPHES